MAANSELVIDYALELYPNEGHWDAYVAWFGGTSILNRNNDNAGVDIYCVKDQDVPFTGSATLLDLGVRAKMFKRVNEIPEPCHFWTAPRSSIWKNGVTQANSLGVIDRSYRGTLFGAVLPIPKGDTSTPIEIKAGTRLFQILAPDMGHIKHITLRRLSELDTTSRGEGGFGSTGK
jgi:dUTP pyrophosphatase